MHTYKLQTYRQRYMHSYIHTGIYKLTIIGIDGANSKISIEEFALAKEKRSERVSSIPDELLLHEATLRYNKWNF